MKNRPLLLLVPAFCFLLNSSANAALYVGTAYEGFGYGTTVDAGNPASDGNVGLNNGGTGWNATGDSSIANSTAWGTGTNVSTATNASVVAGSLASLSTPSGNSLSLVAGMVGRSLGQSVDAGSLYISYANQRNTDSIRTINLALFSGATEKFGFGQYATTSAAASSNGNLAGVFLNNNPTNLIVPATPIAFGTGVTHQIIMRIDFNASGINERVRVYVDPAAVVDEALLIPYLDNSAFDLGAIDIIRPFTGGATTTGVILAAGSAQFDEFRVGSTFRQVTSPIPEPAAGMLAGLGLLGLLRRRRSN